MNQVEIDRLGKTIWDYSVLNQELEPAHAILAMGSMDLRVAKRAAEVWKQGLAPLIVASGGLGRLTSKVWAESEAKKFAEAMYKAGVPKENVLIEDKSTNVGENFNFSIDLLRSKSIEPKKIIVVTKTYMERRAYATAKKLFPEIDFMVTSPNLSYEQYSNSEISKEDMINIMVGDLQRIKIYPDKGFTIPQRIPAEVESAMERLIALGYDKQTIKR